MPLYIEKINGDVDRPTNQPTDQRGEYRAICLFRKLENRKKAEICNNSDYYTPFWHKNVSNSFRFEAAEGEGLWYSASAPPVILNYVLVKLLLLFNKMTEQIWKKTRIKSRNM